MARISCVIPYMLELMQFGAIASFLLACRILHDSYQVLNLVHAFAFALYLMTKKVSLLKLIIDLALDLPSILACELESVVFRLDS